MKSLSFRSLGVFAFLCFANGATAQVLTLTRGSDLLVQEYYCIDDTGVLEKPLCIPAEQAETEATPSVRGSHSLKQQNQVATKADIIQLSTKVSKLEAKLQRIPNTFNNRRRTEKLKAEILAMHYQLTLLTAGLSN